MRIPVTIEIEQVCIYLLVAGLVFLNSCGFGTDGEGHPEIPLLEDIEIDDSFFRDHNPDPESGNDFQAFLKAQDRVIDSSEFMSSEISSPIFFLFISSQGLPEFEGGRWIWDFSISESGNFDVALEVFADVNETAGEVEWDFTFTGTGTPFGEINDLNAIEMTSGLDNSTGELFLFSPEDPETAVLELEWDIDSDDEKIIHMKTRSAEEENEEWREVLMSYLQQGKQFSLTFNDSEEDEDSPVEIYWNTQTLEGSISNPLHTECWAEDLTTAGC